MLENFILKGDSELEAPRLRAVLNQYIPEKIEGRSADLLLHTDQALAKADLVEAARAMDMAMKELVSEFRQERQA